MQEPLIIRRRVHAFPSWPVSVFDGQRRSSCCNWRSLLPSTTCRPRRCSCPSMRVSVWMIFHIPRRSTCARSCAPFCLTEHDMVHTRNLSPAIVFSQPSLPIEERHRRASLFEALLVASRRRRTRASEKGARRCPTYCSSVPFVLSCIDAVHDSTSVAPSRHCILLIEERLPRRCL